MKVKIEDGYTITYLKDLSEFLNSNKIIELDIREIED
jgi:hypothetical protein